MNNRNKRIKPLAALFVLILSVGCSHYGHWERCENQSLDPYPSWTLVSRTVVPFIPIAETYEFGVMVDSNKVYKFKSWWR